MPASETPANPNNQTEQPEPQATAVLEAPSDISHEPTAGEPLQHAFQKSRSSSRYVDYDTHELLEKISQYEDERRWQRIREGIWISLLLHIVFFSGLTWIPRYVFHTPQVIDPFDAIKQRKDLTYLDELPDALKQIQKAKPKIPVLKPNDTVVDKKTLQALNAMPRPTPPPPPQPAPQPVAEAPQPPPPTVATPQPSPTLPMDTPRPSPVPARPSFSMPSQNPADQLRQAMRDSARNQSQDGGLRPMPIPQLPGAAKGGSQFLSDTQGVDFSAWKIRFDTEMIRAWYPLVPEEVRPPIGRRGVVVVRFKVQSNGQIMPGSMILEGRSGDTALDRAAWGAITSADFPPLPHDFHGPFIEMRATFLYNVEDSR